MPKLESEEIPHAIAALKEARENATNGPMVQWAGHGFSLMDESRPDEWPITPRSKHSDEIEHRFATAYTPQDQRFIALAADTAVPIIEAQQMLLREAMDNLKTCRSHVVEAHKRDEGYYGTKIDLISIDQCIDKLTAALAPKEHADAD